MKRKIVLSGFTLIEVLAVVFVVALIASLVVININRDEDKIALLEAKKFAGLAAHLQDESILQGYSLGITTESDNKGYYFSRLKEQWQNIDDDELLRSRILPEIVKFSLVDLDNENARNNNDIEAQANLTVAETKTPQLIVEPEGLISNFEARFKGKFKIYVVKSDENQEISVLGLQTK